MAILEILEYPDPRLRTKAKPITQFDDALQAKIDDMFETMYQASGIGLAATQVDIHEQLIVMDLSEEKNDPLVLINLKITEKRGFEELDEGCLSFPGVYAKVQRANEVTIEAQDRQGQTFTLDASGLKAVCIQHEMDHLEGKLFVDYLSPLKRDRIRKKLKKLQKGR
ncbi:peptide deformylase [Pleionea sp. CnH1-48]|uniref:peptide deformylase n=1 Tax=Pleionea sp. CnH1-48 TaxID=2954494 RepID=UPI0020975F92|nr:peptide deformylase [Pleionea sp. CnH1-48]MCO7226569.1 peptide deformylase [Pleionea sp. CnH1-48]